MLEGNLDDTCNQQRMYQSTGDNQELAQELTYNVQAAKQYRMTLVSCNEKNKMLKIFFSGVVTEHCSDDQLIQFTNIR